MTQPAFDQFDVIVQGAGPVGLACTGWLLQNNPSLRVLLLDRSPEDDAAIISGDQRGIAISEGSRLLLNTLGAWPKEAPSIHQVNVSHRGHFGRAVMTREEINQEALGHIVRYADIHLALRQALKKLRPSYPNFEWRFESKLESLTVHEHSQCCCIHAEGGLFQDQEAKDQHRDYEQSALIGWVQATNVAPHQAWERFTDEGPLALLPSHRGPGYLNLVWCSRPETAQRRVETPAKELLAELQIAFGDLVGQFTSINDLRTYPLGLNARNEIVKGSEVWIGNAAQTLHPVAGQGLNLGLRDAATLSNCLSPALCSPNESRASAIHQALEGYTKLRQGDRNATIGTTDFLARVFTSKLVPVVIARGLALSALQWMPRVKSALARQMMFGQR